VAALGNNTLEVVDLKAARVRTVQGFGAPQGVAYVEQFNRLFVTSGGANRVDVLDGTTLAVIGRIEGVDDADNVRYDAKTQRVFVGQGSGALLVLDARTGAAAGKIELPGQPEAFQLEEGGERIFVNVPSKRQIAVTGRRQMKVLGSWEVAGAKANFPMALDEPGKRLFVGTRSPAELLIYDTDTGSLAARLPIGGDVDDLFFDPARKRIYAICGEGVISVVQQADGDHFTPLEKVATAPGARTGLFVPSTGALYVAVPARANRGAEIRVYAVH